MVPEMLLGFHNFEEAAMPFPVGGALLLPQLLQFIIHPVPALMIHPRAENICVCIIVLHQRNSSS
jgi:hypothetical protein